jgi:predicted AlkP superfamily pyrophosphatase or phosphodiesterase
MKLLVFSADALVWEDIEYFKSLPNYRKYLSGGAEIKGLRSIYPTVTYPVHVTMLTGTYPDRHKVTSNFEFHPGKKKLPWYWYHNQTQGSDIFDTAKKAGLSTGAVFWPVTGNHPSIDYLVGSVWTEGPGDTIHKVFARTGSNKEVLKIIDKYKGIFTEWEYPSWDIFRINCACDIIKQFNPDVMFVHPFNIDHYRHESGIFNDKVTKGIEETDQWLGQLMETYGSVGGEEPTIVLLSDHGQINISRIINVNVLFADYGLIRLDDKGNLLEWDAYCLSNGASAMVFLKDPDDPRLYEKTYSLIRHFRDEGIYGIGEVFTEPDIRSKEHLGGAFSFVLETDGYTSFGDEWERPLVKNFDAADYRYGRATHGYLPDKGPQPPFIARGPGIKNGITIEKGRMIDVAPTLAKILGVEMLDTDGKSINEILINP